MFFLSSVANFNQRLVSFELSSDSVINTSWSSPASRKFSRILIRFKSGKFLISLFNLVDFVKWLDDHLYFLRNNFKFIKLIKNIN